MADINQARFTINGTPSEDPTTGDPQYTAANAETLTCTLEVNPSLALSAIFEVFDPADLESPLASKNAGLITWTENGLPAITVGQVPFGINDSVNVDMPVSGVVSYIIRCTVSTPGSGIPQTQQQVFERLVFVQTAVSTPLLRKTIPGETTQARLRAWSDALNDMVDAIEAAAVGGGGGTTLQIAYDTGAGTIATTAGKPVRFSNTVDATDLLMLDKTFAGGGAGINMFMGPNHTGIGILVDQNATFAGAVGLQIDADATAQGTGLEIIHAGTGTALIVQDGGAVEFSVDVSGGLIDLAGNTDTDIQITSDGTGGLSLLSLGTGDILVDAGGNIAQIDGDTVDLNAANGLTIDTVVGDLVLTAQTTAGDIMILSLTGNIIVTADDEINIDATDIGITASNDIEIIAENTGNASLQATGSGLLGLSSNTGDVIMTTIVGGINISVQGASTADLTLDIIGTGDLVLRAQNGQVEFTDVGGTLTLSQTGDLVLDETGAGEVLNGATSVVGAINRLARTSVILGHIIGLHIENDSVTPDEIVNIDLGQAASEDGTFLIESTGSLAIDITVDGVGGLDNGLAVPVAADTWYAVWVIADTTGVNAVDAVFSVGFTQAGITFPAGYDIARRVGAVRTDATSDILIFGQPKKSGQSRWTYWKETVIIETAGTATSYTGTTISAGTRVPPTAKNQQIGMLVTKLGASSLAVLASVVPAGWNEAAGHMPWTVAAGTSSSTDIAINGIFEMPVDETNQIVRYLVAPAGQAQADVLVKGWEDAL